MNAPQYAASLTVSRVFDTFLLDVSAQLSMTAIGVSSNDAYWVDPRQHVARVIADCFSAVRQVRSICAEFNADGITIWTLLDTYDRGARELVYEQELKVCERLRIYDFDFRVSSVDVVPPADLVKTGSVEIYRRR